MKYQLNDPKTSATIKFFEQRKNSISTISDIKSLQFTVFL